MSLALLGKAAPESWEVVRPAQNILGVSVVAVGKNYYDNSGEVISSKIFRRITVNTLMNFSGTADSSTLLQYPNGNVVLGTVNNCGAPWGAYLTCEENLNGYFGASESQSFNDKRIDAQ